jgi:hypothetical protein
MTDIDYKLISEIIFTNDTTFTDIDIKNAKIIARVCKLARFNKNIRLSFDRFKVDKYYKQIKYLSEKKTKKDVEKYDIPLDERLGAMDLDINIKYKSKIYNIIINLLKENNYIIEGVKKKMVIEQKNNIKKYVSKLKKMYVFISDIGVDINNITDDERDSLNDYVEYFEVKWNMAEIMTIFKYNSYFINMLSINLVNEKVVIDFISSEYFTKRWRKIPIIFPKSLLENLSLNLAYDY